MHKDVEKIYIKYLKKYYISISWFIFLNILSFSVAAGLIFLNAYAIKKNSSDFLKIIFVIIAILEAISAFIITLSSFFKIRKQSQEHWYYDSTK